MIISLKQNGGGGTAGVTSVNGKSGKITLANINGKDLTSVDNQTVVQGITSGDKSATIDSLGRAFLKTINGESLAGDGDITIGGGSGDLLKSRNEFPETAEYGDVVSKAEEILIPSGSWSAYQTGTVNIDSTLSYTSLWSEDTVLLGLEWFGNHPRLKYTFDGTIILTDGNYAEVFEEVHQGETKSYEYRGISDSSKTYTLTVDWSTEGRVRVYGPTDYSHRIAIEQTFKDPKPSIEYKYGMYEYVHYGEWAKVIDNTTGDNKILEIGYEYLPEDKGNLPIATVNSNGTIFNVEYSVEDKAVKVGDNILTEGVEATFGSSIHVFKVLWENNIIRISSQYNYPTFTPAEYTMLDFWRKISDDTKADAADVTAGSGIPHWNKQGIIDGKTTDCNRYSLQINNSSYSNYMYYFGNTGNPVPRIYAPIAAGTSGQVLVSGGDNVAPSWTSMIKSVRITEDEYEALAVKDNNTLYLIVEE